MTPFLKWPGGKRNLADRILRELPDADTYVEPFLGAGAVALAAMSAGRFQNYLLADADQDLIDTWVAIRNDVSGVLGVARLLTAERSALPVPLRQKHYYTVRAAFNEDKGDSVLTAGRLLYLNIYGYNGLYRKNKSGGFNTPYGHQDKGKNAHHQTKEPPFERIQQASDLLNRHNVVFHCGDFSEIRVPEGAVGFYDPPYWPRQGNGFTQYTAKGFTEKDQQDLAEHFKTQRGYCVMTNGPGALHLYDGLPVVSLNEPTVIGPKKAQRGAAETLLIANKPAPSST